MSHHSFSSVSFPGRTCRTVGTRKSLFLFALGILAFSTGTSAFALAPTTTTLTVTSAGSAVTTVPGQTVVTLTATVEAGTTPLTVGQVNFCDATAALCTDIHLLGTAQLTSAGTAVLSFRPGIGSHSYKAVFLGTKTYASSFSGNSALTVTGKYATTTAIAQSGTFGSYSLTATVTGVVNSSLLDSTTGTVSFLDTSNENATVGSGALGTGAFALNWVNSPLPPVVGFSHDQDAQPYAVVADFNGDGIPDLVLGNVDIDSTNVNVVPYLGNGDGTFRAVANPTYISVNQPVVMVAADFNGDGIPDLALASGDANDPGPFFVSVYLGNGDGTFQTPPAYTRITTASLPSSLAVADFNGDGIPDLALIVNNENYVTILLGNGDGTFSVVATTPATANGPGSIAAGDFNGDGIADLAVTGASDSVTILLGNGDGTFTAAASPVMGGFANLDTPNALVVGDFNGDGKADIAVATIVGPSVLLGNGDGTFAVTNYTALSSGNTSLVIGDFNGDGHADLAGTTDGYCYAGPNGTVCQYGTVNVLLGNGDGTFAPATESPTVGLTPGALAAGDFNGDGVPDLAVTNSIYAGTVLLAQPTLTATATASGLALTANTGTHYVEASYPGDGNYNSSVSGTTGLITAANLSLSATALSFGNQGVGYSTPPQSVTLTNTGGAALAIGSIGLTGANAANFVISNTCGTSLPAGASCNVGARFVPGATGGASASVTLNSSLSTTPQNIINLSGTGVSAGEAGFAPTTQSLSFGNEPVGYSTDAQEVFVSNNGSSAILYFNSITLTGPNASSFVTSNTCGGSVGGSLNPSATCRIGVRFVPTATGPATATVTVTGNAPNSPLTIALSGNGIAAPTTSLSLSTSSLAFGNQAVGTSTQEQSVTVTNSSATATLYFKTITLGGTNTSSFVTSNTCDGAAGGGLGGSLGPHSRCIIGVRFAPTTTGPLAATITVTENSTSSPQTITLTGTGQ